MALDLDRLPDGYLALWRERHLYTLTTLRPDGTPHVVPVGATYDPAARVVRVIASDGSRKVRNVDAYGPGGAPAAVSAVDGARWTTIEGIATVRRDADEVAEAVRRYTERYRPPRDNPRRVVIRIEATRALGRG